MTLKDGYVTYLMKLKEIVFQLFEKGYHVLKKKNFLFGTLQYNNLNFREI